MLKAAALDRAVTLVRYLSAISVHGAGKISGESLEAAGAELRKALETAQGPKAGAAESGRLAAALFTVGAALKDLQEGTGISGFGALANEAAFLSLVFTGFSLRP